ncbi:hypothetical protein [Arthrobacter sp. Soil763]|uniref:hypothetical protein n=1 Tax=Arthrobacter sp. Soil763 TaxID=1736402 RepID=UPI0006FC5CF7|nr:hypothetical protein [Arthrobacter sp. Soil763]KRE78306.1 hypothetical protein ASG71_10420 [Arthrobacter sp. Soil763]
MDTTGPHSAQPARDSVESDPAYDFAEDAPVGDAETVDEELLEEADRLVPLDAEDFLGDEQPIEPADADEFRAPEDEE